MRHIYQPLSHIDDRFLRSPTASKIRLDSQTVGDHVVSKNERAVLRAVFRDRSLSRSDLVQMLGLTQQSVHRLCETLVERGLITLGAPKHNAGRGQPSPVPNLQAGYAYSVGLSINTDSAGLTLMRFDGGYDVWSVPIQRLSLEGALDRIYGSVMSKLAEQNLPQETFFGLGCGIAGYAVGNGSYNAPLPLHEWSLIELAPIISQRFGGIPVWTDNGANTAALAEAMFGVGRYTDDFVYMSYNYGFGGAVVLNGELWRGSHGNAGELSGGFDHMQTLKRPALKLLIDHIAKEGVVVASLEDLKARFDPEWPGVEEWVEDVLPQHNMLVSMIMAFVDPSLIVYGGEVPQKLAEMFINRTTIHNSLRYGVPRKVGKQVISDIPANASAIGASALPFKACFF